MKLNRVNILKITAFSCMGALLVSAYNFGEGLKQKTAGLTTESKALREGVSRLAVKVELLNKKPGDTIKTAEQQPPLTPPTP